ncbi:hypothetical protein GALMADRAFT_243610 [Galerina marginata CBS 339.88]|uniref:BTB domain-containing protein n=1 Tax=Galerina marginata (strain CBS 339.88) TaxID=685588 RepID=A0A067TAZ8_GALM3|nr:hypothetical protein GALMADRAFT_243610 [Galerina marginata CBS 339.88]
MSLSNSTPLPSSAKRKHDDQQQPVIVRSPDFWFEDGNIIIQAQNTQFRVYRGSIARQSAVFNVMFGLPQPEGEILVDGCPIVYLDDASQDWKNLFTILYHPEVGYDPSDTFDLLALSSVLRLGQKYDLEKLYDAALKRIKSEVPQSLEQWQAKFGRNSTKPSPLCGKHVELLNIICDAEIQPLLPAAYLLCIMNITLENTFRPLLSADGTVLRLSPDSIEKLAVGRVRICQAIAQHKYGWCRTYDPAKNPDCLDQHKCVKARLDCLMNLSTGIKWDALGKVFRSLSPSIRDKLCANCVDKIMPLYEAGVEKIWDELPTYFGLPAWADLK